MKPAVWATYYIVLRGEEGGVMPHPFRENVSVRPTDLHSAHSAVVYRLRCALSFLVHAMPLLPHGVVKTPIGTVIAEQRGA